MKALLHLTNDVVPFDLVNDRNGFSLVVRAPHLPETQQNRSRSLVVRGDVSRVLGAIPAPACPLEVDDGNLKRVCRSQ
jgi:hypothetical protein